MSGSLAARGIPRRIYLWEATLSFDEALYWLDERGGRWSTRASRSAVNVVVTLGGQQVRATAQRLHPEEVRQALVAAVQRLRTMLTAA